MRCTRSRPFGKGILPSEKDIREPGKGEPRTLFWLFGWRIEKKHFYSLSSLVLSSVIGIAIISQIRQSGSIISANFSAGIFLLSIIVILLFLFWKHGKKDKSKRHFAGALVAIYSTNLVFVLVFILLHITMTGQIMTIWEILFIISLSAAFSTVSLHMH